jgi:two-component system, OmpR family, response regulator
VQSATQIFAEDHRRQQMKVLIVEDEPALLDFLVSLVVGQGILADGVGTIDEAMAALATSAYDLIVLDRTLPDGDGMDLLRVLKRPAPPVLLLTAREGTMDVVQGLNHGAEDYLTKPFEPDELLARMRVLFRRSAGTGVVPIRVGNLSLIVGSGLAEVSGKPFTLPRREYLILETLTKRHGRIVNRQMLEDAVYGFDDEVQSNTLEAQISRLRRRLREADTSVSIHVMRGVGYMLSQDVD